MIIRGIKKLFYEKIGIIKPIFDFFSFFPSIQFSHPFLLSLLFIEES